MPCDSATKFERTRITNINSNSAALPPTTQGSADTIGGGVDNSCLPPLSEDMEVTERLLPRTDDSNGKSIFFIGPTDYIGCRVRFSELTASLSIHFRVVRTISGISFKWLA